MTADPTSWPDRAFLLADPRLRAFSGSHSLVTGGLGFIASNLVHALTILGSSVTVVDALVPGQGGNRFNLAGIADKVDLRIADIRDTEEMQRAVQGQDFIFNLAARVSHIDSLEEPFEDLDVNVRGHLVFLEAVRRNAPRARGGWPPPE